ncbi:glycosyltransferase family 4 protein [Aquibium sp. ELW1220]|uniref:glycosyltransferase family 4 protein n=1 Tax=Aquibium sp. ELW1220 TaxID=2976766 RepID=UPI0025AF8207|nr:glycosyltransferase family 4 protein [Aquibium sp. ELW1220]MDN2583378.1 glycosyltransferase family 4 protein [Aquibium sp. ELW1220]
MGARRAYELARMLEDRGALAALHTSTAWREGETPSRLYSQFFGMTDSIVKRRTVLGIPAHKVRTIFLSEPVGKLCERLGTGHQTRFRVEDWVLGRSARRAGLAGASVVLNTTGNGGTAFLRWARGQGARIATDIVITPSVYDILAEERRRWPGWEPAPGFATDAVRYRRHIEEVVAVSDLLLSPSETVDDGLATVTGFDAGKLARVPYGLGSAILQAGAPVPKRVLFAGQAGLRKGLPYLAEAARLLTPLGYDIRVAGTTPAGIRERPDCAALTFLGHLGPDEMAQGFRTADVFCLPSLAEGMASVTLEALASGLPCVVTRSAGAPVRDGVDGAIVPERNGPAIAAAIRAICEDRPTRARMSEAALWTASAHRLEVVGDRLHAVLAGLVGAHGSADLSHPCLPPKSFR